MFIRARAPLRLSFAGGGTDVSPYCDTYGGMVFNATIDKYAYATIETDNSGRASFVSAEREEKWEGDLREAFEPDGNLVLHKAVYNRIMRDYVRPKNGEGAINGIKITTYADVPAGSGLGSSSTIVVAMIAAFAELLALPLGQHDAPRLRSQQEGQIARTPLR